MKIAITGSSGFIGSELAQRLAAQGHHLIALQRKPSAVKIANVEYRDFHFTYESSFAAAEDAEVLVHCAFIRFGKEHKNAFRQNVKGTLKLYEMCRQKGIHFIFLSTMSAHAGALSDYGKHKFEIESKLDAAVCNILKLGLVVGSRGGLFNSIKEIISKTSIIPLVDGGKQPIQIIHIEDLCRLIQKISEQRISGIYNIGTPQVYTLKYLYEQIALKLNKQLTFIPLPFFFMNLMLSITEKLGLNLPVTTENLLGLKQLKAFDTQADLHKLNVELMSLEEAVKRS